MAEQVIMEEVKEVKPKKTTTRKTAVKDENVEATPKKRTTKKTADVEAEKVETPVEEKVEKPKKTTTRKAPAKKAKVEKAPEFLGTGKRKSSVARVRVSVGTGEFKVNGRDVKEYFKLDSLVYVAKQPLMLTNLADTLDVSVNVQGGGFAGQAGAVRHGITEALLEFKPELRAELKKAAFITRDARIKERKKYGLKKARKAPQFSKR